MTMPRSVMIGAAGGAGYTAQGVQFDGTNDYLSKNTDLTGNANSKLWTVSFWFNKDVSVEDKIYGADLDKVIINMASNDKIQVKARDVSNNTDLNISSATAISKNAWHHCLFSVDMANTANRHLFIDDVDDLLVSTYNNDTLDFTQPVHSIGATAAGAFKWGGDLADVWIDFGRYVDFSIVANRRLFITAGLCPVDLGDDGSIPFSAAPIMYFSGATAAWHTNKGDGGGFTENGALTDAATNPC